MRVTRVNTEMALESFKANSKLLQLLDAKGVSMLAEAGTAFQVAPGTIVVRQGAPSDSFYLIAKGGMRVIVHDGVESKEVARLAAGAFFGEMGVLTDAPRRATVMTIGKSVLIRFPGDKVTAILENYPKVREVLGLVGIQRTQANFDAGVNDG
jgi:CRP-like cAMP-binding protein